MRLQLERLPRIKKVMVVDRRWDCWRTSHWKSAQSDNTHVQITWQVFGHWSWGVVQAGCTPANCTWNLAMTSFPSHLLQMVPVRQAKTPSRCNSTLVTHLASTVRPVAVLDCCLAAALAETTRVFLAALAGATAARFCTHYRIWSSGEAMKVSVGRKEQCNWFCLASHLAPTCSMLTDHDKT